MNLNLSFGIIITLFLVSGVNIRHFSKISRICQGSQTVCQKTPISEHISCIIELHLRLGRKSLEASVDIACNIHNTPQSLNISMNISHTSGQPHALHGMSGGTEISWLGTKCTCKVTKLPGTQCFL